MEMPHYQEHKLLSGFHESTEANIHPLNVGLLALAMALQQKLRKLYWNSLNVSFFCVNIDVTVKLDTKLQ